MTCSSGRKIPRLPTWRKRGSSSGTLTRAKRSSPLSGSRTNTPRLKREAGDVGKRLARPHGERRQHREHLTLVAVRELVHFLAAEVVDPADDDARLGERRLQLPPPQLRLPGGELGDELPDLDKCLLRRSAVG